MVIKYVETTNVVFSFEGAGSKPARFEWIPHINPSRYYLKVAALSFSKKEMSEPLLKVFLIAKDFTQTAMSTHSFFFYLKKITYYIHTYAQTGSGIIN